MVIQKKNKNKQKESAANSFLLLYYLTKKLLKVKQPFLFEVRVNGGWSFPGQLFNLFLLMDYFLNFNMFKTR
jgi:hypothetical protein